MRTTAAQRVLLWLNTGDQAFRYIKHATGNTKLPLAPKHNFATYTTTGAPNTVVAAVLQQWLDGTWLPLAFFSNKLKLCQTRYSAFCDELQAIYLTVSHLRHLGESRCLTIHTDHKLFIYALGCSGSPHCAREIAQLVFLSEFITNIQNKKR